MNETNWNQIIKHSTGVAAAGDDASPTGIEFLDNLLYPNLQQEKEFGQQVALQQMQNEWNSEGERMKRMIDAGINPNTAAAGIAGAPASSSASAPNSAIGSGASGLQSVSGALDAVSGAANTIREFSKLGAEKENIKASTAELLEKAGLNHWQALAISELLPDMKREKKADVYLKLAEVDKVRQEYQNLCVERDKKFAEINKLEREAKYLEQLGDVAEAQASKLEAEAGKAEIEKWFAEQDKLLWLNHGYRMDDTVDQSLRNSIINGHADAAAKIGESIELSSNLESKGQFSAESDYAFAISNARKNGENVSDVAYGRIGSAFDMVGRISSLGTNLLLNAAKGIKSWFQSGPTPEEMRSKLTDVLNECYSKLNTASDNDKVALNNLIYQINCALQLDNKELEQWYKTTYSK